MTEAQAGEPAGAVPVDVEFRAQRVICTVFWTSVALEVGLVLLDYHVNYGGLTDIAALRRLANITREDSLASWIGTTQTLLVALTLWAVVVVVRRTTKSRWRRTGWLVLACSFTLMAVDDGAMLHERVGTAISEINSSEAEGDVGGTTPGGLLDAFPSYAWQAVFLPFLIALGVFLFVFLRGELAGQRLLWIVLLALSCFALAVALDFIEGLEREHPWNLYGYLTRTFDFGDYTEYRFGHDAYDTLAHFSKSIEEALEMLANTLFWYVFLRSYVRVAPDVRLRLR